MRRLTVAQVRFQQDSYALVSLVALYEVSEAPQVPAKAENLLDMTSHSEIGFYEQSRSSAPPNFTIGAHRF